MKMVLASMWVKGLRHAWPAGLALAVLAAGGLPGRAEADGSLCDRVRERTRPAGAPRASDVIMRSLRVRPRDAQDPHDTLQALRDFHATTLAWAYIDDPAFIRDVQAAGRVFGGAASAPSYLGSGPEEDWYEKVVIVDREGRPIIAPWKRTWKRTLWGCMNNPELERGYVAYLKRSIDAGAHMMQRDEPGGNLSATRWGGCFCDHCMEGFRRYLAEHADSGELRAMGVGDLAAFDYRERLRAAGAPAGDAFAAWDGGALKGLFVDFQEASTVAFHRRTRRALDDHAGRRVPFSCNNGVRLWGEIELAFDWAFGELAYSRATAHQLYRALREAADRGRVQIVTMPKKGNGDDPAEWERRTRRTIAMAYACGGLCMVPWDVYMPNDRPRYFGAPEQYADLFGFIRANRARFDGYEEAAAAGHGIPPGGPAEPGVRLIGGERVSAIVRAVPGDAETAVVIHLVDWAEQPAPFKLQLDPVLFFGGRPVTMRLLRSPPYAAALHARAEETGDCGPLSESVPLEPDGQWTVEVPALAPWGLVVVEPAGD